MSITQRYWLVWAPGLILAGFFSVQLMIAVFIPSYLAYYGHRKEWSVGKFALVATGIAIALYLLATSRV